VLSLQLLGPSDRGAGFWSEFPPTPDHDAAAYADVASNLTNAREALMMGHPHFVVELFGVDHGTKGSGLGKRLLLRACEIADEVGLPIFVMANASARGIYQHPEIGFEVKDVKVLPGEMRYEEYMLVRPGRKLNGRSEMY
jgi:GNAT superfamily N-acetyltransferase